ncbi:metallophosphoesterase [Pseudochelatococcus lubricantis]|uniref:metallophosphoesterase n=1 Tax=Pseudochelatococcus lubricantis TaxID=1538102 RepID=UPI0035E6880D
MTHTLTLTFSVAPDAEIFAIGDIHGHAPLLDDLLERIARTPRLPGKRRIVVFLGDLINRGPQSIATLDLAAAAHERVQADEVVGLWGNHEQMLRLAMLPAHDPRCISARALWMQHGGPGFLAELGIGSPFALADALGERRLAWLTGLRPHFRSGNVLFVHGGVNPRIPLAAFLLAPVEVDIAKLDYDLHWAWIRYTFARFEPRQEGRRGHQGVFVAHGHLQGHLDVVTRADAQLARDRINLDGGSYSTGRARMARFVDDRLSLFEAAVTETGIPGKGFDAVPVDWIDTVS